MDNYLVLRKTVCSKCESLVGKEVASKVDEETFNRLIRENDAEDGVDVSFSTSTFPQGEHDVGYKGELRLTFSDKCRFC